MADSYEHIRLVRVPDTTTRRSGNGPIVEEPADLPNHARNVRKSFEMARAKQDAGDESQGGYDERYLFKFRTRDRVDTSVLGSFGSVEVISEEDDAVFLAFVDEQALETFRERLRELEGDGTPTRRRVLWALQKAENWTAEDRTGYALATEGLPESDEMVLDVQLWPLVDNRGIRQGFEDWCDVRDIPIIDNFLSANLLLYRVRVSAEQAESLLEHRDVRSVDLPPRFGVERDLLSLDIDDYPELDGPPPSAPAVVVLDSGLASGHPLLESSVGDAQSFVADEDESDSTGHGTAVAGIALWGDVARVVSSEFATPLHWIMSGKVLYADAHDNSAYDREFIENQVTRAVEYFVDNYGCRVFNLSFGDERHPYQGGHLGGLAVTLDELARKYGVLFIISTGNYRGANGLPEDWRADYPEYLLGEDAALLDPAGALNCLTVGSYARHEATFGENRGQLGRQIVMGVPIARSNQPSPFTRSGPSLGGAIKPELIEVGGNKALSAAGRLDDRGLGRVTTSREFMRGKVLCEKSGTSFAAPHVSYLAGRVFTEIPNASANLVRALLVANAEPLTGIGNLLHESDEPKAADRERVTRLCGYGTVNERALYRSDEDEVGLMVEEAIADDQNHFYEIPLPEEFWSKGLRQREITVALAHTPAVRSTRRDYKATALDFRLARETSYQAVKDACDREKEDDFDSLDRVTTGRTHSSTIRNAGTVQCSTWTFRRATVDCREKKFFVVVRRNDKSWGSGIVDEMEEYALVVIVRDREREEAQLYTRIQAILRARAQARS